MRPMPRPLVLLLVLAAQPALAMQFIAAPPFIHLSGHVEPTDWPVWQDAMERYAGKVDTIVFHDSTGGHSNTRPRIGHSIPEKGLRTVVAGPRVFARGHNVPRRRKRPVRVPGR